MSKTGQEIRVVFDINVYVDTIKPPHKNTYECFKAIESRQDLMLVYSPYILKKALKVLRSEVKASTSEFEKFTSMIRSLSPKLILEDIGEPFGSEVNTVGNLKLDDSHIYNLARKSDSSLIVTSDSDFERVKNLSRDIAIVSPARFIRLTSPKKPPTKPSLGLQFGMNPLDFQPGKSGFGQQI